MKNSGKKIFAALVDGRPAIVVDRSASSACGFFVDPETFTSLGLGKSVFLAGLGEALEIACQPFASSPEILAEFYRRLHEDPFHGSSDGEGWGDLLSDHPELIDDMNEVRKSVFEGDLK